MILRNKRGQESQRELRLKVIEVERDGDRTLFVFDRPRDVKGTAFLVHAHKDEPDDQWGATFAERIGSLALARS